MSQIVQQWSRLEATREAARAAFYKKPQVTFKYFKCKLLFIFTILLLSLIIIFINFNLLLLFIQAFLHYLSTNLLFSFKWWPSSAKLSIFLSFLCIISLLIYLNWLSFIRRGILLYLSHSLPDNCVFAKMAERSKAKIAKRSYKSKSLIVCLPARWF